MTDNADVVVVDVFGADCVFATTFVVVAAGAGAAVTAGTVTGVDERTGVEVEAKA